MVHGVVTDVRWLRRRIARGPTHSAQANGNRLRLQVIGSQSRPSGGDVDVDTDHVGPYSPRAPDGSTSSPTTGALTGCERRSRTSKIQDALRCYSPYFLNTCAPPPPAQRGSSSQRSEVSEHQDPRFCASRNPPGSTRRRLGHTKPGTASHPTHEGPSTSHPTRGLVVADRPQTS